MEFCKNCGTVLAFAGMVCPRCGNFKGTDADNAATGKISLIRTLEKFRDLLGETEELRGMIKPQSEFPMSNEQIYKKRSFMHFFWPFLVGGIGAGTLIYIISTVISVFSLADSVQYYSSDMDSLSTRMVGDVYAGYFAGLIIAVIIIIVGTKIAKRKRDDINRNADLMNQIATERYQQGVRNQKMIDLYQENLNNMRKYENLVPEEFQTFDKVNQIIELLKEDKANTIEEACAQLS